MPIKDIAPYMLIMQYPSKDSIDVKELMQKLGRSKQQIMSFISHAAHDSGIYKELRITGGYAESQIPAWFARKGTVASKHREAEARRMEADASHEKSQGAGEQRESTDIGRKPTEDAHLTKSAHGSQQQDTSDSGSPPLTPEGANRSTVKVELPVIPGGGKKEMPTQFLTPLGQVVEGQELREEKQEMPKENMSQTPQGGSGGIYFDEATFERSLEEKGIIKTADGRYLQGITTPDGKIRYAEVDVSALMPRSGVGSQLNQLAIQTLNTNVEGILRKTALNPELFLCYSFATTMKDPRTGNKLFEGDFADFINSHVLLAMKLIYGYVPMMAKVQKGLMDYQMEGGMNYVR